MNLYSSCFSIDDNNIVYNEQAGEGRFVNFFILSPRYEIIDYNGDEIINDDDVVMEKMTLEEGTYNLVSGHTSLNSMEYNSTIRTSPDESGNFTATPLKSGSLNVSHSGNNYEITYEGVDDLNLSVSGNFKGEIITAK